MKRLTTIEIRLVGERQNQPLSPRTVGVSYLIESLGYARDLITVSGKTDYDPVVTLHEGSLALRFELDGPEAAILENKLRDVSATRLLDGLSKPLRRALEGFQKLARRNGDTAYFRHEEKELLSIRPDTAFQESAVWVRSEVYLRGKVTNAGGVSNPNLHVETDDPRFGKLLVSTTQEQLANDEKNRLYKPQTLRVEIQQDARTGAFDLRSARLLEFVATQAITDIGAYLDALIDRAKGSWSEVKDAESWLANIRGYEG